MDRQTDGGAMLTVAPLGRVALSITFQYRVNGRYIRYVTDKRSNCLNKTGCTNIKLLFSLKFIRHHMDNVHVWQNYFCVHLASTDEAEYQI